MDDNKEKMGTPGKETAGTQEKTASVDEKAAMRQKLHKRHMRALRDILIRLGVLLLVVYTLFFHLVGVTKMPSGDMYPRIDAGDFVLYYRLEKNDIHAQDIIVFEKPTASLEASYQEHKEAETVKTVGKAWWRKALDWLGFRDPADPPKTLFVCRVVAGPGDTVEIGESSHLIVNGNPQVETGIFYPTPVYEGFVRYPLTLRDGEYFVLADYRNGGADSRFFGAVRLDEVLGTVITIARRNNL